MAWMVYLQVRNMNGWSLAQLQDSNHSYQLTLNPYALALIAIILILGLFFGPQSNKIPPRGRVPRLARWLEKAPVRPRVAGPATAAPRARDLSTLHFEPVGSVNELWDVFTFTSTRLVEDVPSAVRTSGALADTFSRAALFPVVALEWKRYEGCAVDEVSLGPSSSSLSFAGDAVAAPPILTRRNGDSETDIVAQCSELIDEFGLSVVARLPGQPIAGVATLRVKRLPSECHVEEYEDGLNEVVCVDYDAALDAPGLEAVAYLEIIAVAKDWRGSGLANRLLQWVEEKSRAWGLSIMALHVHRDNWAALKFYERNGYESTSDWLGLGPDFFLLLKPL